MPRLPGLLPALLPAHLLQPGPPRPAAGGPGPDRLPGAPGGLRVPPGGRAAGRSAHRQPLLVHPASSASSGNDSIGRFQSAAVFMFRPSLSCMQPSSGQLDQSRGGARMFQLMLPGNLKLPLKGVAFSSMRSTHRGQCELGCILGFSNSSQYKSIALQWTLHHFSSTISCFRVGCNL